jgi:hypothetical protein
MPRETKVQKAAREAAETEAAPNVAPEAPEMPDAVLVTKNTDEQGNITVEVSPVGNVQATEIQTILELGVARWRSMIGLGPKTG